MHDCDIADDAEDRRLEKLSPLEKLQMVGEYRRLFREQAVQIDKYIASIERDLYKIKTEQVSSGQPLSPRYWILRTDLEELQAMRAMCEKLAPPEQPSLFRRILSAVQKVLTGSQPNLRVVNHAEEQL